MLLLQDKGILQLVERSLWQRRDMIHWGRSEVLLSRIDELLAFQGERWLQIAEGAGCLCGVYCVYEKMMCVFTRRNYTKLTRRTISAEGGNYASPS